MRSPYIMQDRITDKLTSFGIAGSWFYFYEEVLCAIYDRKNRTMHLLDISRGSPPPILPSYRYINAEILDRCQGDIDPDKAMHIVIESYDDLQRSAMALAGQAVFDQTITKIV